MDMLPCDVTRPPPEMPALFNNVPSVTIAPHGDYYASAQPVLPSASPINLQAVNLPPFVAPGFYGPIAFPLTISPEVAHGPPIVHNLDESHLARSPPGFQNPAENHPARHHRPLINGANGFTKCGVFTAADLEREFFDKQFENLSVTDYLEDPNKVSILLPFFFFQFCVVS
ncbi:hypothetical protein ElyMa_006058300 [Elysia marginata]|uniref:Uncharacterized protein n=1 Tax=Elysia marginata TaxID=1093978 RepID=A0AAV4GM84_9GAST|nr:hypothetical protein ElyMa_006058300 [Elysia marginata]